MFQKCPLLNWKQLYRHTRYTSYLCYSSLSTRQPISTASSQMASARTVKLEPTQRPVYAVPKLTQASADKTSELLNSDFVNHHIFFNDIGFHNHIAHGLLSLYATGATPEQLQKHYVANSAYQRPHVKPEPSALRELHDAAKFKEHLGDENYFLDYVAFFQEQVESKGWQQAFVDEFLAGTERSDNLLVRLYAGLYHPLIHMGFGIEFEQPLVMAEGYGEACVHSAGLTPFYYGCEKAAKQKPQKGRGMLDIVNEGRENPKIKSAVTWGDFNNISVLVDQARDEVLELCSSYQVKPDDIDERLAEMANFNAYMLAASQRPPHHVKFDFFLMHSHNCAIFFHNLAKAPWIPIEARARLLEWKGRTDIINFWARGSPNLPLEEITSYKPKQDGSWEDIIARGNAMPEDDGHAVKCIRAVKAAEELCANYPNAGEIKGADMWLKIGHMAIDSVEEKAGPEWVRQCGFDEAWEDVPERPKASL